MDVDEDFVWFWYGGWYFGEDQGVGGVVMVDGGGLYGVFLVWVFLFGFGDIYVEIF